MSRPERATDRDAVHVATCHCGQVRIAIPALPATVTSCNCSLCRRYGTLWAYYTREQVSLEADPAKLSAYRWGDRTIDFWHCTECGCLTHYTSVDEGPGARFVVNARMLPLGVMESLTVRHLDGADTWEFLD